MATQGERRALLFLGAVALLGAGSRACRARHLAVDTTGIAQQIEAVDGRIVGRIDGSADRRIGGSRRRRSADTSIRRSVDPSIRQSVDPPIRQSVDPPIRQAVDLDAASATEIERLPGIGPALAKRIVNDRAANGPFGCLRALDRVKGIGPALLAKIDSLATFSGVGGAQCAWPGRQPAGSGRQ